MSRSVKYALKIPRYNRYTCIACQESITTIEEVEITTPYMLLCRRRGCDGSMISHYYKVPQEGPADFAWVLRKGRECTPDNPAKLVKVSA